MDSRESLGRKVAKRNGLRKAKIAVAVKARRHFASHVDRWNRVQLVDEGDCCLAEFLTNGRKGRLSPDDGDGEFGRFFRASKRATAMATLNRQRRLTPSCGGSLRPRRERWAAARTIVGEVDTQTRNQRTKSAKSGPAVE